MEATLAYKGGDIVDRINQLTQNTQYGPLLRPKEAAAYLNVQPGTLKTWRWSGKGPRFMKVGNRSIRYRLEDLEAFIQQN
jgi:excisionase family DNA binding protein